MDTAYRVFNTLSDGAVVVSQVTGWEGAGMADPEYLRVLVATPSFWTRLREATRGVGARRERTRPEQFLALRVQMPIIDQQRFGAGVFAQIAALKRLQAGTAVELDALLPSVLGRAFKGEL